MTDALAAAMQPATGQLPTRLLPLAGYHEVAPIAPGFREARRDLYNLWPLFVHARLFGGSYVDQVDRIVARFGC
jgi:fructosamine-3-kinase